jgi:glutaredoxin
LNATPTLTLYYRSGCSLCEDMQAELFAAQPRYGFALQTIDVDSSEALVTQYGHKVPVLTSGQSGHEEEICHYFLDHSALAGCFSGG